MSPKIRVDLSVVRLDGGTQQRAALSDEVVSEYAEAMQAGARFPPVTVFFDGTDYWLADGFHRFAAVQRIPRRRKIDAEVIQGTLREAILHSVGVNAQHGLRRSNADKRNAVETLLNDPEWALWSDREIARQCSVSAQFVNNRRHALTVNDGQLAPPAADRTYTTKHGTVATMDTTRIGGSQTTAPGLTPPPAPARASSPDRAPDYPQLPALPAARPAITVHEHLPPGMATMANTIWTPPASAVPTAVPTGDDGPDIDLSRAQVLLSALRAAYDERMADPGGYRPNGDWWKALPQSVRSAYAGWAVDEYPGLPRSPEPFDPNTGEPPPLPPLSPDGPLPDLIDIEENIDAALFETLEEASSQGKLGQERCASPLHLGALLDGRYDGVSWVHVGGEYGDDDGTIWLWEAVSPEAWGDNQLLDIHDLLNAWRTNEREPWDFRGLLLSGPWDGGIVLGARRLRLRCVAGLRHAGEAPIPGDELHRLDWRTYNSTSAGNIHDYILRFASQATLARLWRRTHPRPGPWEDTPANRQHLTLAVASRVWSLPDSSPTQLDICRHLHRHRPASQD